MATVTKSNYPQSIRELTLASKQVKRQILILANASKDDGAHIGSALSVSDALLVSYYLKKSISNGLSFKDINITLSKGHAVLALYGVLRNFEVLTDTDIENYGDERSNLLGHPLMDRANDVNFTTGSLGLGPGLALGQHLGLIQKGFNPFSIVIIGDGECDEGSIWEAAQIIPRLVPHSFLIIVDVNGWQQTKQSGNAVSIVELGARWKSFGWKVAEIDGHNLEQLLTSIRGTADDCPSVILCRTVKGHGFELLEGDNAWHHASLSDEMLSKLLNLEK